jgi:cytochrome c553
LNRFGFKDENMKKILLAFVALLVSSSVWAASGDPVKGKKVAEAACAACHGATGESVAPTMPHLAGQIQDYMVKQLKDMKGRNGEPPVRENPMMAAVLPGLGEEDMVNVAAWYASQKPVTGASQNARLAALGQQVWRAGDAEHGVAACAGCHGPVGAGVPALYPRLAGQWADYTQAQLTNFKSLARHNDPNEIMRDMAHRLTNEEIRALADFVAGLH